MKNKAVLTTGDIAKHCHVSSETVANWVRSGKLAAYLTPGQHRRVHLGDFRSFLKEHDMPPLEEDQKERRKILVVDDDPIMVELIVHNFRNKKAGFELATAVDGFEAGTQMIRFAPDLVILDLVLPNMDGFKVCRKIKSDPATSHTIVLVITAYGDEANIQRALNCGADFCMKKPFKLAALEDKIDELLAPRVGQAIDAAVEAHS